jgi:hypothetical protein
MKTAPAASSAGEPMTSPRVSNAHFTVPLKPPLPLARGLHSFPFQLSLSSSVHHMTQLNSMTVAQFEL